MKPLHERLTAGETLVADGATGTVLLEMGLELGECPESVCLEQPETLETIARQYVDAGADIVHTNTFGASPIKLSLHGLAHEVARINETAVLALRRAVGDRAYISGSCGPCGQLLKPYGEAEHDAVYESFREQAKYLADSGVDAICVETMTDLTEAVLAVKAARDAQWRINELRGNLQKPPLTSHYEALRFRGVDAGVPRAPLRGMTEAEREDLKQRLDSLGVL